MKYIVYITTNNINNKVYIGVHKTENPEKFDGYLGCGVKTTMPSTYMNPTTAFQYAVKKYGPKNFQRRTLYIYETEEQAYSKEKELVTKEFIDSDTNYNMITGGGYLRSSDSIYQFDENGILIRKWETMDDASLFFNCTNNSFKNSIHFKEKLFGFFWSKDSNIDINSFSKGDNKRRVYKYTLSGKLIQEYESILYCAKQNNLSVTSLISAIKGNSLVDNSYYYSYKLYDIFIPKIKISLKNKQFYLYTLNGDFIQEFKNTNSLMQFLNVKSWGSIWDIINRRDGLYKNYQIKLYYANKIEKKENKNLSKQIDVYTKDGNLVKTYDSISLLCKELNVKTSSVNRILRGVACSSKGYIFKYHKNSDIV